MWIGLEHTRRDSSLLIVPYSHRFGLTVQQIRSQLGKRREETTNDDIVSWARDRNERSHLLHTHREEELKVLLTGEVDLIFGDERRRLKAGQFVYYPAEFAHTLETVNETPANYLTFKWHTDSTETGEQLPFRIFDIPDDVEESESNEGFRPQLLFEGRTACLRKFHGHFSTLMPGAGYDPHVDAHDGAIVVLEGEVETVGERVGPHGVIFHPAGELHGFRNPGAAIARYLVLEFQAGQNALETSHSHVRPVRLQRVKTRLKQLLHRFGKRM